MTGTPFNQNTFNAYDYNDRSEVVGGQKYQGIDPNDKTNPVRSYDYDYNYDPIGNRQTFNESGTQTTYTTNPLNQYDAITGLTDPQHDLDGNMTFLPSTSGGGAGGEGWHCQWNGENRLVVAESADTKLTFTYDYMGRRVRKRSYSGSAILGWTLDEDLRYIYNNWNIIAQFSLQPSSLIPDKTYTWGLDLSQTLPGAGGVGGLRPRTSDLRPLAPYLRRQRQRLRVHRPGRHHRRPLRILPLRQTHHHRWNHPRSLRSPLLDQVSGLRDQALLLRLPVLQPGTGEVGK